MMDFLISPTPVSITVNVGPPASTVTQSSTGPPNPVVNKATESTAASTAVLGETAAASPTERTYCICKSKDDKRFMICCDSCNNWFHGDCVNVKSEQAKKIKHFYCPSCQEQKNLSIVYKMRHSSQSQNDSDVEPSKKRQRKDCGNCIGCFRTEDCGRCDICKANKAAAADPLSTLSARKLKCRLRQCVNSTMTIAKPTSKKADSQKDKESSSCAKLKNVSKKKPSTASGSTKETASSSGKAPGFNQFNSSSGTGIICNGTTRAGVKAYKNFMMEAGMLHDDEPEDDIRQCFGPGCVLPARKGSKYCSDETCGMKLARARLMEILPGRIQQWNASPSVAEEFERKRLENIEMQMEQARQKLAGLQTDEEKLNKWLDEAKKVKCGDQPEMDDDDDAECSLYCPTCGHEISARTALRHINRCFNKYENQTSFGSSCRTLNNVYNIFCDTYNKTSRTYCKRLRVICPEHHKEPKVDEDDICASPLSANIPLDQFNISSACGAQKKSCAKHYKWDKIRRATIDMERLAQLLKLDELYDEQRALKTAMQARGGVLALLLHQTISHQDSSPTGTNANASSGSETNDYTSVPPSSKSAEAEVDKIIS